MFHIYCHFPCLFSTCWPAGKLGSWIYCVVYSIDATFFAFYWNIIFNVLFNSPYWNCCYSSTYCCHYSYWIFSCIYKFKILWPIYYCCIFPAGTYDVTNWWFLLVVTFKFAITTASYNVEDIWQIPPQSIYYLSIWICCCLFISCTYCSFSYKCFIIRKFFILVIILFQFIFLPLIVKFVVLFLLLAR